MTESEIAEIEARVNMATKGPWLYFQTNEGLSICSSGGPCEDHFVPSPHCHKCVVIDDILEIRDAAFIAASRQDVPALLAHIREQQKKIATLRTANQDVLDAKYDLSNAYLRLRYIIGPAAFNTPHAPTAEQVWETTENALCALLRKLRQLNQDACETEERCRRLLAVYDKSSPDGVVPLDEVIEVVLRKEPAPFADSNQRVREIVQAWLSETFRDDYIKQIPADTLVARIVAALDGAQR